MVVLARAWMPRGTLSLARYSSLLALHLTVAFDIAEFGHLMVGLLSTPATWINDTATSVRWAVLLFVGAGMILLAVMEGGLESESKNTDKKYIRQIFWTLLLLLLLDGPYFILRIYVVATFKIDIEDMQLLFVMKNILVVVFGTYRIITLFLAWRYDKSHTLDDEEKPKESVKQSYPLGRKPSCTFYVISNL